MSSPKDTKVHVNLLLNWVEGGLLVKSLDCGSKGLALQSHLQQRFISLPGALSPTPQKLAPLTVHIVVSIHREMRMDLNKKTLVSQEYCTGFVDCRHTNLRTSYHTLCATG